MEMFFSIIKIAFFVLLGLMIVGIIIVFISAAQEEKKTEEQKHVERVIYLIKLFTNIKLKWNDVKLLDYEFNYGWPVEIIYRFQILKPVNEPVLLDFDSYKTQNPPDSYDVLISKESGEQVYIITCLDFDDKQNMI